MRGFATFFCCHSFAISWFAKNDLFFLLHSSVVEKQIGVGRTDDQTLLRRERNAKVNKKVIFFMLTPARNLLYEKS